MGLGDVTVLVHSPRGAPNNGFQVFAVLKWLVVGVQLLRSDVAQILGVLRAVVTTNAPGQLVFGQVSRDELDGVVGIGLAGLTGRQHSGVHGFFGDLQEDARQQGRYCRRAPLQLT